MAGLAGFQGTSEVGKGVSNSSSLANTFSLSSLANTFNLSGLILQVFSD